MKNQYPKLAILDGRNLEAIPREKRKDYIQQTAIQLGGQMTNAPSGGTYIALPGMFEVAAATEGDPVTLVNWIREVNPDCLVGVDLNVFQANIKQPDPEGFIYDPFQAEMSSFCTATNSWLQYLDGSSVFTVQPATGQTFRVYDVSFEGVQRRMGAIIHRLVNRYGADFVFCDEAHGVLGFLPNAPALYLRGIGDPTTPKLRDAAWSTSITNVLRKGGIFAVINGTHDPTPMTNGFYAENSQNAIRHAIYQLHDWTFSAPLSRRLQLLHVQVADPEEAAFYMACASLVDAHIVTTALPSLASAWVPTIPSALAQLGAPLDESGADDVPLLDYGLGGDVVSRDFQGGTLKVDFLFRSYSVAPTQKGEAA